MSSHTPDNDGAERREAELALLEAMYPSEISWHEQRQEITYKPETGGSLVVRVPDGYPGATQPELIQVFDVTKEDIRDIFRKKVNDLLLTNEGEVLDAIIQAYDDLLHEQQETSVATTPALTDGKLVREHELMTYKTVVVWLHHLLNTNKRKLALSPTADLGQISGLTKPGYPGILVYSGTALAVDAHIVELKNQHWQAFQVRLEEVSESAWSFQHATSIRELESMSDVVQAILSDEQRQKFLEAVGIK